MAPDTKDLSTPAQATWDGPVAAAPDEGASNHLQFGPVTVLLQGPPGEVAQAYKALLMLQGKLKGDVLTPLSILKLWA